jgi:hypothetical protein
MHLSRTTTVATSGLIAIGAVLAADVAVPAAPADAAERASSALTAKVTRIDHLAGRVTLAGVAEPGRNVFVGGDVEQPATVRVGVDGAWRAVVSVAKGEHALQVASDADWTPIAVPVRVVVPLAPSWTESVDGYARQVAMQGGRAPAGATMVISVDDVEAARIRTDAEGRWSAVLGGLSFGEHAVRVDQRFDGAVNGSTTLGYLIDGTPRVDSAEVVADAGTIALRGAAPFGTRVAIRHEDGSPVLGADGSPVEVESFRGDWNATIPLPGGDERLYGLTAVTLDGDDEAGTAQVSVVIPIPLTAEAEFASADRVRLHGGAEPGATVTFLGEDGAPLRDEDDVPISTVAGRGTWQRTVDSRRLAGTRIMVEQHVDGRLLGRTTVTVPVATTR